MSMPFLSIVVVSWNIERELPRTIQSLSPGYQKGISASEYEIIVVDNGSTRLPDIKKLREHGADITLIRNEQPGISPVRAINLGLNASVGKHVGVFIDGARLASPGLLARAREALATHPRAVVGSRGRYLGKKFQRDSIREGYTAAVEDAMLAKIQWEKNGYALFGASVFDESSGRTWFDPISESNSLFLSRALWAELGGFDPAFVTEGGLVNLDTWVRACTLPNVSPIVLLGEATFHQLHGGVMTNNGSPEKFDRLEAEYIALRGHKYRQPTVPLNFLGTFVSPPRAHELLRLTEQEKIRNLEHTRIRLESEIEVLKNTLSEIEQSKSWTVTAPLRALKARAKDVAATIRKP